MNSMPMSLAVLPIEGVNWLCSTRGECVKLRAKAPGAADARYTIAPDSSMLAVLDSNSKRAGLFRILAEEPWLERVLPFANLPKRCVGHALAVVGDNLLVGGEAKTSEALWMRTAGSAGPWRAIPLPAEIALPGKAIDGLLLDGNRLIAVDNFVLPKWVLVYAAEGPGELRQTDAIELRSHTSYERVCATAWGRPGAALLSQGINHGVFSVYLSVLDANTLQEIAVWSSHSLGHAGHTQKPVGGPLLGARDIAFVGDQLLVACGEDGLLRIDLGTWRPGSSKEPAPVFEPAPGLVRVDRIVVPTPSLEAGAFAVGLVANGDLAATWVEIGSALGG